MSLQFRKRWPERWEGDTLSERSSGKEICRRFAAPGYEEYRSIWDGVLGERMYGGHGIKLGGEQNGNILYYGS